MSSNWEIIKLLSKAGKSLDDEAKKTISDFLLGQIASSGGFKNRFGDVDLYYTSFGLACADSVQMKLPLRKLNGYLDEQNPEQMDLIHLSCFIRSIRYKQKMNLPKALQNTKFLTDFAKMAKVDGMDLLDKFSFDGGYRMNIDQQVTPYAIFLAVTAIKNGGGKIADKAGLINKINQFRIEGKGWSNITGSKSSSLNATTAAVVTILDCGGEVERGAIDWLWSQQCSQSGGFFASPGSPLPDLLSTSSALLALYLCGESIPLSIKNKCYGFVMDHWCDNGGFSGTVADDLSDVEYTFYALLIIGVLIS